MILNLFNRRTDVSALIKITWGCFRRQVLSIEIAKSGSGKEKNVCFTEYIYVHIEYLKRETSCGFFWVLSQIVENKNVECKMVENIWSKIIKSKRQKRRTDKNVENKKVEDWNVENGLSPYPLKLSLTKKTQILFFHFNSGYTVATFPLFNAENVSVDFTYYCQRQGNFLRQKCKTSMNRFIVF